MFQHLFSLPALRVSALLVGDRGLDLLTGMAALILVERRFGEAAFGTYSFLLAVYVLGSTLAGAGSARAIEIRLPQIPQQTPQLIAAGRRLAWRQALAVGLMLLLLLAVDGDRLTAVNERTIAYPLLALAIAINGFNRLRLAVLHGLGSHGVAVRLQLGKRAGFLLLLILLLALGLPPSLLVAAFLGSELLQALAGHRAFALPAGLTDATLRAELRRSGWQHLLSGEALGLLFFIDLFLLGLFVPSPQVGVYAEAALFGRLFMLLPVALQPLLRERCGQLRAAGSDLQLLREQRRLTRLAFLFHAMLALALTLSFPRLLEMVFGLRNGFTLPFNLLILMLPGLLLAAPLAPVEALSEAAGLGDRLQQLTLKSLLLNLGLNLYLIPFVGPFGAAAATSLALLFHFLRCGLWLPAPLQPPRATLLLAAGSVYLGYVLLHHGLPDGLTAVWAAPPLILFLSAWAGLFSDRRPEVFSWPSPLEGGTHERT